MKINVNTGKRTPKMRILSAFMAVLIFSLTFTNLIGQLGIRVKAASPNTYGYSKGNGIVTTQPGYSQYLGFDYNDSHDSSGTDNGTYTGRILPVSASVYDYLTDAEKNEDHNTTWNNINDTRYTFWSRYNPYDKFNTAISDDSTSNDIKITSPASDNITLIYDPGEWGATFVYVYLFNSSDSSEFHPLPGDKMEEGSDDKYRLTFKASDLGSNTYDRIKFINFYYSGTNNNTIANWQTHQTSINGTSGISQTNSKGKSYTIKRTGWSDGKADIEQNGGAGTADAIIVKAQSPLYLGNFLSEISDNSDSQPHISDDDEVAVTKRYNGNDDPQSYDTTGKSNISPSESNSGSYNNFYWQANISQRPANLGVGGKGDWGDRPIAAIQGLVDSTLTDGKITLNSTALPYFDSRWSGVSSGYMKCWENTSAEPISFPFYEVLKQIDSTEQYSRFYQYNVLDSTVHFNTTKKRFEERNPAQVNTTSGDDFAKVKSGGSLNESIRAATGKVGYFPFNDGRSGSKTGQGDSYVADNGSSGKKNNYGFGTKFEMTFKLEEDGKIAAVTSQGKPIESGAQRVDTLFEFKGDDDLWVFIDGNLVLDMGGSHAASAGRINFATKTATVDNAITYGTGGADNLGLSGSPKSISITDKIKGGYKIGTNKNEAADHVQNNLSKPLRNGYDPEEIHTMTIFYMERGMSESNLYISFNFPVESNFNKMKVKEQTDFSGINAGLKDLTMKAADTDVFRYKVENKGTKNSDVLQYNAEYPTKVDYVRTVQGVKTKLTSSTTSGTPASKYFQPGETVDNAWHTVADVSYEWVDEYAKDTSNNVMGSGVHASEKTTATTDSDGGGYMYLMYGTPADGDTSQVKSSGEFEGQFARYSLMKVTQDDDLFTPSTHDTTGGAASLTSVYTENSTPQQRKVSDYYDLKRNYIFSTLNNESNNEVFDITNGQEFNFRNNIEPTTSGDTTVYTVGGTDGHTDANEKSSVVMTVQFINTPKVGALSITKKLDDDSTSNDYVTFKIKLEKVFGVDNVTVADYRKVTIVGAKDETLSNLDNLESNVYGVFRIKPGDTATIYGIPVSTKYEVVEALTDDEKLLYEESETKYYDADSNYNQKTDKRADNQISGTIAEGVEDSEKTNNYDYKATYGNTGFVVNVRIGDYITLTKTDTNGTAITSSPATYYLLKLNSTFDAAYENDPAAISNTFKNAGSVSALSSYIDLSVGPLQTDSDGKLTVYKTDIEGAYRTAHGSTTDFNYNGQYFFYEVQAPYGYQIDNALTYTDSSGSVHSKIVTVSDSNKTPTISYPDPMSISVSIHKTNPSGEGLENGEFDLYYKQNNTTTPPPTYSYNKPETSPVPEATTKINRNTLTVPEDAAGTSSVTTYTYKYSYPSKPSMPSSAEEDWILPRSDNDYIYFRDYNTGTINNKDTEAFYYQDHNNDQKRYWINTWLNNNEFGQNEEIGYDHRYKIKAQFTKSDGSGFKEYEAWERFVDEYTDTANNSSNSTRKTVVWKIQPPDGYSKVRFCLYDGGQCIRTTQEFKYVLGNIYTKTGQGDGTDHQWNYPVKGEHWSTNWNGTGADQSDKRMSYSTFYNTNGTATGNAGVNTNNYVYNNTQNETSNQQAPEQTQRYTATEQKIVFQCNSKQVWHNIHIEFFSSANENNRIGQGFPGYMMEPYAFAGNDYRMKGYLTYELTIPKGATHFRINNGVLSGSFAYKTKITQLSTDTSKNNYGNFFKFPTTPQNGSYNTVDLSQWTEKEIKNAGDAYKATYNTAEVESDYDYIYFRLPSGSGWSSHVYAYFYGGGDLRAHNWQRGVYSIWPGVAPVATEYSVTDGTDTAQHSDHYTYEYTQTLFSETPTNAGSITGINPESTFQYDGGTVYKFKIPKSEKVTYENNGKRVYDKVIFNDGSSRYSNGQETGMIGFKAGYIYSPSNTNGKKYYGDATSNYTGRGDYLYINNAANWDNLHVTFYNANGTAILQGGTGYIMQYEGTNANGKYYRIPIPSGAAKFKLNNGKGSGLESTGMGVIYPKQSQDTSKKDYTTGDMIYTLNADKSLTKDYPNFTAPTAVAHTSSSSTLQASNVDYVTRGDKLYIRNTANWSGMNIGAVKIKFYDSSNAVIGTGEYTMIVSETESASVASDNRTNGTGSSTAAKWYSIDIPMNATKFELTAPHATATKYDIYERINSDGSTERSYKWTKGDMYYETSSTNALTLLYPTYYQSVDYTATDTYASARGDNLYLVVSDLDKWENMRVTFYDDNGAAITNTAGDTAIVPNYIGHKGYSPTNSEAVGYWFKIAIPTGAESFRATGSASNSDSGDIYELSQNRTYHFRNDYTPGDMQYRITDTISGGTYNLSLMYPIFTEEPFYSLNDEVNNSYPTNNITIPTPTSGTNDAPVLYETGSDNITYNWTESTADGKLRFDKTNVSSWSTIKAQFYNGTSKVGDNTSMTHESGNIYKIDVPTQTYTKVVISSGNYSTTVDGSNFADKKIVARTPVVQQSSRKYLFWVPNTNADNNQFCWFYDSEDQHISSYVGDNVGPDHNEDYYLKWDNVNNVISNSQLPRINKNDGSYNSINVRKVKIPPGAVKVKFACGFNTSGDNGVLYETSKIMISTIVAGNGLYANSISVENGQHWGTANTQTFSLSSAGLEDGSTVITCDVYDYTSGSLSQKSATYQPEDRYGYIADVASMQDYASNFSSSSTTDNFVKVSVTDIDTPYIRFYDTTDNVINISTTSDVANAVGLKVTKMTVGSTDYTSVAQSSSPYTIRIPKGAKKISVGDGTNWSSHINLFTNYANEFTANMSGTTVSISQNTSTSRSTNSTALQSGVTADEGFIFYKGTMTHAYYYGGVDGEFCAWPGVPYSYTYTDGSDTVYAFQIPTTSGGTAVYPYVIFNDGTTNSNHTMTAAISYTGGKIYENTSTTNQYGSWSAAPKTVTHTTKTTPTPQGDPDDTPPEYTEIHLATIVTGADGRQKYIKWLKPKPGAEDEVDTEYLDHTATDIGKDVGIKEVRVKKLGEYYWVETVAPAGYKAVKDKIEFTLTQADTAAGSYITHIVDEPLPGKVLLMKTAKEKVGNTDIGDALLGAKFKLTTKADLNTAIKVARKTDKSEYYVIPDISAGATDESKEEYIAISQSGEYETISATVTLIVPDPENEGQTKNVTVNKLKEYDELVTDENGYIKIENLVWGDYVLTETAAPHGYSAAANGTPNTVTFTVGKNNSDITQELSLKDEMEPSYIKLFEHINERKDAWGDPTFTFKIKQTHEYIHTYNDSTDTWTDTLTEIPDYLQKEVLVSLTVNDDGTGTNVLASSVTTTDFTDWLVESTDEMKDSKREYQGMYHIDSEGRIRVEPGTYEITRMPVSRYKFVTSAYTDQYDNGGTAGNQTENLDNNNAPLEKVTVSGLEAGKTIDVHYYDKVGYYDKFSQVDTKVNKFYTLNSNKENATVKGIRIDDYYVADSGTVSGDTLTISTNDVTKFKAYKIMADGTEQQITDSTELAKLAVTYTYDSSSKDNEQFDDDFSYSNSTITVNNALRYHDSVYKLNVSYDNKFTTTFNIVFEKQSANVTYYTAQIIFKNDSQDTTSANTDTNISYFEEDGNRTHAYEFTFVIADDNGTKTVSDIRHNGTSIETDATAWTNALSTMNSSFNILSGYNYSRDSWVQLTPSSPSLTDYNSIVDYITGLTPTDGKVDSIEFAAHLTSS